ncbi:hypothetical protein ETAA8_66210 [Anatilimnocola aggregata]|uniref:Uncharacterized protein n=1 Tax=Anatilimnocola aggregata TaxID=2528021 RepID=A0A517YML4_9BACT|nr:hypothetical protein [Anatilimnocola aggregata]QDU31463.1 hypothetical protein ETAA8_66210 [Anatilimnocola aggregata]
MAKKQAAPQIIPAAKASPNEVSEESKALALAKMVINQYGGSVDSAIEAVKNYEPNPIGQLIDANGGKDSVLAILASLKAS